MTLNTNELPLDQLLNAVACMPARGLFVSFEGIDGAGKSTHIANLEKAFRESGREVVLTREPGGTPLAEKLRALILHDAMDPLAEALLCFAGRRDHLSQVILPAIERGAVVLCDRFTDSTYAYQGGGRKFDTGILATLEQWVQQGVQPDLTIWFDLPPQVAEERRAAARTADRFEALDTTFFDNVRAGYAARMHAQPDRFVRLDALQSIPKVWDELCEKFGERLAQHGKAPARRAAP